MGINIGEFRSFCSFLFFLVYVCASDVELGPTTSDNASARVLGSHHVGSSLILYDGFTKRIFNSNLILFFQYLRAIYGLI